MIGYFRDRNPRQIIAVVAAYGLQHPVTNRGVSEKAYYDVVQQYHVEILQALALTLSEGEWGRRPVTPDVVQAVFDAIVELGDVYQKMRQSALKTECNREQQAVMALRDRLQTHTRIIRNWGYRTDMVEYSKDLYGPLDSNFQDHYGFSATDIIEVTITLIRIMENRAAEHWTVANEILRSQNLHQLAHRFIAKFPKLYGDPEEFVNVMKEDEHIDIVESRLWSLMDTKLVHLFLFDGEKIAEESGRSIETVNRVLDMLSIQPGDLDRDEMSEFFLNNPISVSPGINVGGEYLFPMPQIGLVHIHDILRSLAGASGFVEKIHKRRAIFLEERVKETFQTILPTARLTQNVQWRFDGAHYETDLLCTVDRIVLIVEAKSGALTVQGLRGLPKRVNSHIQDLVVKPAEQSSRLEELIWRARAGDTAAISTVCPLGIQPNNVESVIRISVTIDDFSMMAIAERELKAAGWVPPELQLAPTLTYANLACVADLLQEPAYFLHYFAERTRSQKLIDLVGDEMDLLGLYLETGFNLDENVLEGGPLITSGLSRPIDNYYNSADAGVEVKKPRPKIHHKLEQIVLQIQSRHREGSTTKALDLLRIGNLEEQRAIFRKIEKLRKRVARTYRDPEHICSLVVHPPAHRDGFVIFYVYPDAIAERRYEVVQQLAEAQFAIQDRSHCVVVGKKIEDWDNPYTFVAVCKRPA